MLWPPSLFLFLLLLLLLLLFPTFTSAFLTNIYHFKAIGTRIYAAKEALPIAEEVILEARDVLRPHFEAVDQHTQRSLQKILSTFRKFKVGTHLFNGVDGYGHGDLGRDVLEDIWADLFGAEAALVRVQIFSGTHAISCALYGVLRPGDVMIAISGKPYDTLEEVIGTRMGRGAEQGYSGSLKEWGIDYEQIPLNDQGTFDLRAIKQAIESQPRARVLHIQRSCGYQWRPSLSISEIAGVIGYIRESVVGGKDLIIFVDNCYGEFVEDQEPTHVGADLVAGSLIKNPGGTMAPTGGYVVGKARYVSAAFKRLSAPGVEGGATLGQTRRLFQGLFLCPTIIGESLKGSLLLSHIFGARFGLNCNPLPSSFHRTDIIQAIQLGTRERVLSFCRQVQRLSPVGAYIEPTAGVTPGYGDEVIFADGTFIDGSTLELSADGPLREPFTVFVQGCTHWTHWSLIVQEALVDMGLARNGADEETEQQAK